MRIELCVLRTADRDSLTGIDGGNGWNSDPELWRTYLADHEKGRRAALIAWNGTRPVGYGSLNWVSDYESFRSSGIPEINNIAVDAAFRRQGVATALIHAFEDIARRAGRTEIGLGVGLYADYGDALRLYWRLGYRPDGRGLTHDYRRVSAGECVCVDDGLILWLSKLLRPPALTHRIRHESRSRQRTRG